MTTKDRYAGIIDWFSVNRPEAASELHFQNPYQLLVAVMLSAQCTDKRINLVTPALFSAWPDAEALSKASVEQVYEKIKSVSYPNAKAEHLVGMAQKVVRDFNGMIPENLKDLQTLPGVGRKTANVIASICFGAAVIAVDTHVFRVARRLGLSSGKTVEKVELDLTKNIPQELRARAHHWLILHGRYVCVARKPKCDECGIKEWCKDYFKNNKTN